MCCSVSSKLLNSMLSYDPQLPADFDPIAMWVEDLPEPQEDSWDLDDDSDDFTDEIESTTCLEDQMTLCLNNF